MSCDTQRVVLIGVVLFLLALVNGVVIVMILGTLIKVDLFRFDRLVPEKTVYKAFGTVESLLGNFSEALRLVALFDPRLAALLLELIFILMIAVVIELLAAIRRSRHRFFF